MTLFVAGVFANNPHDTFPADDPAGFTEFLNRGSDFHLKKGEMRMAGKAGGRALARLGTKETQRSTINKTRTLRAVRTGGGRDSYHNRFAAQGEIGNSILEFSPKPQFILPKQLNVPAGKPAGSENPLLGWPPQRRQA